MIEAEKREVRVGERKRKFCDTMLLALKMEEGVTSQRVQVWIHVNVW